MNNFIDSDTSISVDNLEELIGLITLKSGNDSILRSEIYKLQMETRSLEKKVAALKIMYKSIKEDVDKLHSFLFKILVAIILGFFTFLTARLLISVGVI